MRVDVATIGAAALLAIAVLVWPPSRAHRGAAAGDSVWTGRAPGPRGPAGHTSPGLWQQDPVELFRRWRLRRRSGELADDVLDLLRGVGPALDAGLTPHRSLELAASAALGPERLAQAKESTRQSHRAGVPLRSGRERRPRRGRGMVTGPRSGASVTHDIDRLVGALLCTAEQAEALSSVWAHWAARSGSAELALVAAAWQLSEATGAPLAFAVERAVRGLLDARARRRKVAVAVAGPRATVTVLTVLPLTGPVFGLAVGIDPRTLYLGSTLATSCAAAGAGLVWAGRLWCTRMVRRAVRP